MSTQSDLLAALAQMNQTADDTFARAQAEVDALTASQSTVTAQAATIAADNAFASDAQTAINTLQAKIQQLQSLLPPNATPTPSDTPAPSV